MAATNVEVWQQGDVIEVSDLAADIIRIVIRQSEPVTAAPGSHIDLMVPTPTGVVRRSYSVVSQSDDLRDLTLGVFQVQNSRGGSIAMHGLKPGTTLDITQPLQNFPLRVRAERYLLVAGGIGITALVAMARVLKKIGANYSIVYAARSPEAMAFKDELIAEHGDRITLYFNSENEYINVTELVAATPLGTEVYMCGPIRLMDDIRRHWAESNHDYTNLRFETFGASGWYDPEEFIVRIPAQNVEVLVNRDHSMLEALESAGVEMMYDCRKGECGLCEVRVTSLSGRIDHRDVFYSEHQKQAAEKMSCCVSRVVTSATGLSSDSDQAQGPAVVEIITT